MTAVLSLEQERRGFEASYNLSDNQMNDLVEELLATHEPEGDDNIICYSLDDAHDGRVANIARTIECRRFDQKYGNDSAFMQRAYGPYEAQSRFFLSVDRETKKPIGTVRVITNGPNGFMTIHDVAQERSLEYEEFMGRLKGIYSIASPADCWDIGTAAVLEGYQMQSPLVYRGMYVASQRAGIKHFFSMVDRTALNQMKFLGFPFQPLDEAQWAPYMGSGETLAVYGDAPTFEASVRERETKLAHRAFGRHVFGLLGRGTHDGALQF